MKAHSISMAARGHTDNTNISDKVSLREQAVAGLDELRVLDLFGGENRLWSHFDCARYYGIEIEKGKGQNLRADNLRVIHSLDLTGFNVIDADSYGIPANQIKALYENWDLQEGTVVIYTCITNRISALSKAVVGHFGLDAINRKAGTLIRMKSAELFYALLYDLGVRKVYRYITKAVTNYHKEYGYFVVGKCNQVRHEKA